MKYTERWAKSREKKVQGGIVTPGEQARDLAESWRRATQQISPSTPADQIAPSLDYLNSPKARQNIRQAQEEFIKETPASINPDSAQIDPNSFQALQEAQKKFAQKQQEQKARAAELVTYKLRGSPFLAIGTKEKRDQYIDDYNRKQQIAKLERQKAARRKSK